MLKFSLYLHKTKNDSSEDELKIFDINKCTQILDLLQKKRIKHDIYYCNKILSLNIELQNVKTEKK